MAWKDEWIEVTPTSTNSKQRVKKSTVGGYGKIGKTTYLYADIFNQSDGFAITEGIEEVDNWFGRNSGGSTYKANQESKELRPDGRSCANCRHYSRPHELCVLRKVSLDDTESINNICGDYKR